MVPEEVHLWLAKTTEPPILLLKSTSQMSTSTVDAAQNPVEVDAVIRDFCEETVKRAAELAQSTNLSAEEILEESKLLMAPVASRLKRRRKVTFGCILLRDDITNIVGLCNSLGIIEP
jgi:hypothetical protein